MTGREKIINFCKVSGFRLSAHGMKQWKNNGNYHLQLRV